MQKPILRDFPFPIVTPRLVIAPVRPGTGDELFEATEESRESLSRWMEWEKETKTSDDSEEHLRRSYARYILREDFTLHARERDSESLVVFTGFHRPKWEIGEVEIGYWVRQSAQRKGYASEATNALIRYAFKAMSVNRVCIGCAEGNEASRRVIEKMGFALESRKVKGEALPDGRLVDALMYVRLNTDGLPPLDVRWGVDP